MESIKVSKYINNLQIIFEKTNGEVKCKVNLDCAGFCFICLNPTNQRKENEEIPVYSIGYILRFIGTKFGDLLGSKGAEFVHPTQSILNRSIPGLRVELCLNCAKLLSPKYVQNSYQVVLGDVNKIIWRMKAANYYFPSYKNVVDAVHQWSWKGEPGFHFNVFELLRNEVIFKGIPHTIPTEVPSQFTPKEIPPMMGQDPDFAEVDAVIKKDTIFSCFDNY